MTANRARPPAVDIAAELAPLTPFEGRRPSTQPEEMADTFGVLAETENGAVFAGSFSGESAWERHPNGDELVQILDGATRLRVVGAGGAETVLELSKGMFTIVPRNAWHKFLAPTGVTVMTMTPQPTEHLYEEIDLPPRD